MRRPRISPSLTVLTLTGGLLIPLVSAGSAGAAEHGSSAQGVHQATGAGDVNDFDYSSWESQFDVGVDDEGRATLHVEERLVAEFPDADQNRGIVRGLPMSYRNASIDTEVLSVTDAEGNAVPYETEEDDDVLYILTGTDDFVRGSTSYVIEYEMRDVILAAENTDADEFYWDLLPLDSTQDIGFFRAFVTFDDTLTQALTGSSACYFGESGTTEECTVDGPLMDGTTSTFQTSASDVEAGEGITVAIGFAADTVTQPAARLPNPATDTVPIWLGGGAIALSAATWFAALRFQRNRRRDTGVIVAQYDVPDTLPPLVAAPLVPGAKNVISAEIVHLAVRGALRIEDSTEPPTLRRAAVRITPDPLDEAALEALFHETDSPGVLPLPDSDEEFSTRMTELAKRGETEAAERGLTTRERSRTASIIGWFAIAATVSGIGLGTWGIVSERISAVPGFIVICIAFVAVLISSFMAFSKLPVLTPEGARTYEYLLGVKEFIRVAEADRIRMLQSASGAERRRDGDVDVVVLYERLLPYAMLFGQEKEWGEVLEVAYAEHDSSASWLGGPASPYFAARLALFSSTATASSQYTSPSSSSSSGAGGSMGGGFSGGGGGGGFSGGR
ncbi:MAG: DUF2207 domain-containing protein [Actinomycetota bacterium]